MKQNYYVYILSNFKRTVVYVGVTSDLIKRVLQHKHSLVEGFTKKYQVHDLVCYEVFDDPTSAINFRGLKALDICFKFK